MNIKSLTKRTQQIPLSKNTLLINVLHEIETNKESVNFYIKEENTSQEDTIMLEIAMDMTHIKDKTDYTRHINEKLPRLHDQIIPSSL